MQFLVISCKTNLVSWIVIKSYWARTMATFFLRIRTRFPYKLNKTSWALPEITSKKIRKRQIL